MEPGAEEREGGDREQARVPGVCADEGDLGGLAGPQEAGGRRREAEAGRVAQPRIKTSEMTGR